MESRIYHLHALTALHVGAGHGSGVIDLPIARERATHLPVVPGSGIKGVLRDELMGSPPSADKALLALFGPPTDNADEHAGALVMGDGHLLCLPVRSLQGTFAYATCPFVLQRYRRDWLAVEGDPGPGWAVPQPKDDAHAAVAAGSKLAVEGKLYLEDLDLAVEAAHETAATAIANFIAERLFPGDPSWQALFRERFALLPDPVFDFLAETATELRARVRLTEQRTVAKGALWYEENLPAESVLWGVMGCDRVRRPKVTATPAELLNKLEPERRLQIGGKATVGRGQCRWLVAGAGKGE